MCCIGLHNITNTVLKGIDLEIKNGELVVMIGPSGAGKSTLLNAIAGFVPCTGAICMGDRCVNMLPPHQRRVGYVFQDLYLFPHLSVANNILLAMKNLVWDEEKKKKKLRQVLNCFRLEKLSGKKPEKLSGGEKQRVAMARAVAGEPSVLLLDEPFAHLDCKTACHMRTTFRRIQQELGITTLFVTHDLAEAKRLGDRIVLMKKGRMCNLFTRNILTDCYSEVSSSLFETAEEPLYA